MIGPQSSQAIVGIAALVAVALLSLWWGRPDGHVSDATAPPAPNSQRAEAPQAAPVEQDRPKVAAAADADFDYYVLVLSWSPTHCASERGRGADDDQQCRSGRPYGFVLHGLWPQYERGYPSNCSSDEPRRLDDEVMDRVMKISPSEDLVQHEWEKHGTCSGLSQRDYFAAAARAFNAISIPSDYERPTQALRSTPDDVREAFLNANPKLKSDAVSATCSRNNLAELWICLDKTLTPRACSVEVAKRHCGGREVRMRAVRGDWPR